MPPDSDRALRRRQERLRRRYRPARVRVLFVGEAPPASGRFFYQRDSGLYRALRDAFAEVLPEMREEEFLDVFQAAGCYLIDVCAQPVDRLSEGARRAACRAAEASLARRIRRYQPLVIVTMLRSLKDGVDRAVACAGWQGTRVDVPYPGRWSQHRREFLAGVTPLLRDSAREVHPYRFSTNANNWSPPVARTYCFPSSK